MNDNKNKLIEAVKADALNEVERLLEAADANMTDERGWPLLLVAIKSGASRKMVELLLARGADLTWTTEEGVSLLDEAVEKNRLDLVELFIEKGLDPATTRRKSGMTVLMLAASFDYIEMMELLFANGADIYAQDEFGWTAADFAKRLRRERASRWIEAKMENPF
ncbi:ankyrin repeat domain-containing protein [Hydrogenimonas urashimensis]|uniref:ankyrin repeat domain-containing protein n=1 Tax=Hydrogenimonas urashimensis TaxID=2740515 RepID=UPI00191685E2|nr:ankyrin repeat domain-containing protein [Hydrogenimonas urashimensis]